MPTVSVENYLKAILYLHEEGTQQVSTTELAARVKATPASTSAMLKRLGQRKWVEYKRYRGVRLTEEGERIARILKIKEQMASMPESVRIHFEMASFVDSSLLEELVEHV